MGVLGKAKNAAKHAKLKGEIVLLDRDMNSKKQKFGIELSDLLWDIEAKQSTLGGRKSTYLEALKQEWEVARVDLKAICDQKEEINAKIAVAKSENVAAGQKGQDDPRSAMDKAKAVGTEGKRRTKLQLLERELTSRKQKFGIEVYEAAVKLVASRQSSGGGGTLTDSKNKAADNAANAVANSNKMSFMEKQLAKAAISTVSGALNQLTVSDQDVEKCILKAMEEVTTLQTKKDSKRMEIEQLGVKQEPEQSQQP